MNQSISAVPEPDTVPAYSSRSGEFSQGQGLPPGEPESLEEQQAETNSSVPMRFVANGTTMQLMPSGVGSSAKDQQRMLLGGSFLPVPNGTAQDSYEARIPFDFMGR